MYPSKEDIKKILLAGKIAAECLEYGRTLIKPGVKLLDVAEKVEQKIISLGALPAFPVNISMNDIAAHYTPIPDDKLIFNDEVIKLDVGAHVDGFIGDNALTIDLSGKYSELVTASRKALDNSLKVVRVGAELCEIGQVIEETILKFGFRPVKNLSGHGLGKFEQHSGINIPNYNNHDRIKLERGQLIAIEPFATDGVGLIHERGSPLIFAQILRKPVRSQITREFLNLITPCQGLPFAPRWFSSKISLPKMNFAIKDLDNLGMLHSYAPLVEKNSGIVSQAEHSVFVDDSVKITTRI